MRLWKALALNFRWNVPVFPLHAQSSPHRLILSQIPTRPVVKIFIKYQKVSSHTTGYEQVNPYWYQDHYSGKAKELITKIVKAMYSSDYYDRSDAQTDYFDTAYYAHVNVGSWNKPFIVKWKSTP